MTRCPVPRAHVLLAGLTVAGSLSACTEPSSAVTQQTVTVTATSAPSDPAATPVAELSDVRGRRFDVGQVRSVRTVDGLLVVELDRWTPLGSSDSRLARMGVPVHPHREQLFVNQNRSRTYTAPVARTAQVVENTCVPVGAGRLGLISRPQPAASWLADPDKSTVLLLAYDTSGQVVRMDTDPRC